MLKAYSYRLYPTPVQAELLNKSFGSCRFVYNWALAKKVEIYQSQGKSISCFDLMKFLPGLKEEFEWLKEINSQSFQAEVSNLDSAFTSFFKKNGGFPKFKSKHKSRKSFACPQHCKVDFEAGTLSIPKCKNITAVFSRTFEGKIKTVTVSQSKSGRYFASILVDNGIALPEKSPITEQTAVGIDVGIKHFATLSDGEKVENPKHLKQSEARLKVLQRRQSRKLKGSNNRHKARLRVARLHEHIANQRKDFHHKLSTRLIRENQTVIVETLAVNNMVNNHCLAKAISDCGWSQFKEFLRYKCEWYGRNLVEIGRFEPSSKMCSCGVINSELKLWEREWACHSCGVLHDRDILASQNIKRFGLIQIQSGTPLVSLGSSPVVTGCDEPRIPPPLGVGSVKHETMRRWLRSGKVRGLRLGRDWRISERALNELAHTATNQPKKRTPPKDGGNPLAAALALSNQLTPQIAAGASGGTFNASHELNTIRDELDTMREERDRDLNGG